MALRRPVPEAERISLDWGITIIPAEPPMFSDARRAWWNEFPNSLFHNHFHAAIDYSAVEGSRIIASEDGTVIESLFDWDFGGGNKVRIQIRPGTSYCSNHMAHRSVQVGDHVRRGQVIGRVGSTGNSSGPHDHFWVGMDDEVGSQQWPTLWNPELFFEGGALADDPRIKPLVRHLVLNGAHINIRGSADLDQGSANVWGTSREDGIYRNGERRASLAYRFEFVKWVSTDDGVFAKVIGFKRVLFIYKSLVHFV